ncbi:2Fe-2S iron-sulfur cluster binding domain-containing protein [Paenibacillus mesophilus]|uniref:2Fe-2S iron-sulfur cluster-binding protein n=1 Tax=Paenibacillus mesophilus TaxID=2582849 RepID=UPI00110D77AE|nr:2Fe-2S iron-sulfur cluster-binding protein [Paenibacillus mesophilus]TMV51300.1 2Fe-2S iron-sulfur cluster binding domain-containing protein [Paenibacillus mesophilus]
MNPEIRFLPDDKKVQVKPGTTVLDASKKARVHIRTRCDGNASCLMCKVTVEDGAGLSGPGENERRKLGEMIERGFRLACQAKVLRGCTVRVPEDPLKAAIRAQLAKQREEEQW